MPRRNRVTPLGELIAHPARGSIYGNRGCLHDREGLIRRTHDGRRWISCRLEFGSRRRTPLMQPGRYTELFFLDEATALAAGHRPCAECRRDDFTVFVSLWTDLHDGETRVPEIDRRLHAERLDPLSGRRRLHELDARELPDGTIVLEDGEPWLVAGELEARWTPGGYVDHRERRTRGLGIVVTPPSLVHVLRAGWAPAVTLVDESAFLGVVAPRPTSPARSPHGRRRAGW